MVDQQLENLPAKVTKILLKHRQQILMLIDDAISENTMGENNVTKVA